MTDEKGSEFYKSLSSEKTKGDYEKCRWDTPMGRAHFETTRRTIVDNAFPISHGLHSYLEVGPGPGTWTSLFVETHPDAEFTLTDISEEMLGQARRALANDAIEYVCTDFMRFERAGKDVDFFFSSRALEYIEDKAGFARKVASLLTSGGTGFVVTKCAHPWRDMLRGRKLPERHAHQTTPRALSRALRSAGLEITKVGVAAVTMPLMHSPALNTFLWNILRHLPSFLIPMGIAESFYLSFKKP